MKMIPLFKVSDMQAAIRHYTYVTDTDGNTLRFCQNSSK
jgi:hypothetical protein